MNQKDKQDLELVHYRIDELHSKIDEIRSDMSKAHGKTDESLSFIKENLFNQNPMNYLQDQILLQKK